ncbi:hypothetical protein T459_27600 [Capsicum annuum]|uniref:Uncharacterized protein n=1 Tax=Capsicum annuum TaxID=4072 RepID=A0A2G2YED4_CAPAN|nr:hypothetical protein T459_27600 [Capsicum annuum]
MGGRVMGSPWKNMLMPSVGMVIAVIATVTTMILSKIAMSKGLSSFIIVVYSNFVATRLSSFFLSSIFIFITRETTGRGVANPPRTEQIWKVDQLKEVTRGRKMVQQWRNRNGYPEVATKATELKEVRQTDVASEEHNFPKDKEGQDNSSSSPLGGMGKISYSELMQQNLALRQ